MSSPERLEELASKIACDGANACLECGQGELDSLRLIGWNRLDLSGALKLSG
jgi:hypothetical protein